MLMKYNPVSREVTTVMEEPVRALARGPKESIIYVTQDNQVCTGGGVTIRIVIDFS